MTLVDSNVLIDIFGKDPDWWVWSLQQINERSNRGAIVINDVIYAEVSARFETVESLDAELVALQIEIVSIPRPALFLAGKAFIKYRGAGGARTGVLPDFFIGAHAAVAGLTLLTRDVRRYRNYFPTLDIVAPE